jgi:hypothetical protein
MNNHLVWNLKTGPGSVQEVGTVLGMNNFHGFMELKVIRLEQECWHLVGMMHTYEMLSNLLTLVIIVDGTFIHN